MDTSHVISSTENLPTTSENHRNIVRKLYDWCLSWADTPYGTPALFVMSFAESSFFPLPPDILQVALSVSKPRRAFFYAAVSTIASVLGAIVGWMIGAWLWDTCQGFFYHWIPGFDANNFEKVRGWYNQNAFVSILISAFTPIPYKIFTIASGVFEVGLGTLLVASVIGRGGRFFLVGGTIYLFGPKVKEWIERYFNLATVVLAVLGIGGFVAVKYLHAISH